MPNKIDLNSLHLGKPPEGDWDQKFFVSYLPTSPEEQKPDCPLPPSVIPPVTPIPLVPLDVGCTYNFPDIIPLPPTIDIPQIIPKACERLAIYNAVSVCGGNLSLRYNGMTGDNTCSLTLSGYVPCVSGINGANGVDGINGKDGIDGVNGRDGIDGRDGVDGIGRDGVDGAEGPQGLAGANGVDGKDGKDGEDGKDGKDGVDGKDGAVLDCSSCNSGGGGGGGCKYVMGTDRFGNQRPSDPAAAAAWDAAHASETDSYIPGASTGNGCWNCKATSTCPGSNASASASAWAEASASAFADVWAAINAAAQAAADAYAEAFAAASAAADAYAEARAAASAAAEAKAEASASATAAAQAQAVAEDASWDAVRALDNVDSLWKDSENLWSSLQSAERSIASLKPAFENIYQWIAQAAGHLSQLKASVNAGWSSLDGTIQAIYDYIGCVADGLTLQVDTESMQYCSGGTSTSSFTYVSNVTLESGCGSSGGSSGLDGELIVGNSPEWTGAGIDIG
jgi:hypothetical protein